MEAEAEYYLKWAVQIHQFNPKKYFKGFEGFYYGLRLQRLAAAAGASSRQQANSHSSLVDKTSPSASLKASIPRTLPQSNSKEPKLTHLLYETYVKPSRDIQYEAWRKGEHHFPTTPRPISLLHMFLLTSTTKCCPTPIPSPSGCLLPGSSLAWSQPPAMVDILFDSAAFGN